MKSLVILLIIITITIFITAHLENNFQNFQVIVVKIIIITFI